ncbi:uncharacterized protein B0H18DRAFT_983644 [Fomitopsis serialis]|uniref:uncharacterized protein n=1 Tax=Fomitopsis serialis TaxID=139415 RepID=UPI0020081402|nr:uncharacterized protein B0H18DRAFT_983644 [Neoantrodia serialis]KAH9933428.1 hypothetical protein B0H18DRAFT_983644 [Neoantrodia serialis]
MQLTAALLATLALLCTVFFNFAQAVPLTPSRNDADACASLADCDSCGSSLFWLPEVCHSQSLPLQSTRVDVGSPLTRKAVPRRTVTLGGS